MANSIIVSPKVKEPLYAVVPYFNPWRWKSRHKHALRALEHFHNSGAVIVLVEIAFNRREFELQDLGLEGRSASCGVLGQDHRFRHRHIQLRTKDELWLKENAINLGVAALPYDWQQVCWLDADTHFLRPNWVGECIHKLQHYSFLQMFSHAHDLGVEYQMLPGDYAQAHGEGFVESFQNGNLEAAIFSGYYASKARKLTVPRVWPGLAWACTRQAWEHVGGLIDYAVWGGGDWHMAHALIGDPHKVMMLPSLHDNYRQLVKSWMERCDKHIRGNVGVMSGSIVHHWHGRKTDRGYNAKHSLLAKIQFDPLRHLKRDYQGLWQLQDDGSERFIRLRDTMRVIAKERNEDSIDE
jgi:hypothetical protein